MSSETSRPTTVTSFRGRSRRARAGVLAVTAVGLLISACSSSDSGSKTDAPGASSSGQGPATTTGGSGNTLAALSALQPAPTIPPVSKKPPAGKSLIYVSCTIPSCKAAIGGLEPAAKALGWKYQFIGFDIAKGPSAFDVAFAQALQKKPDFLYFAWINPQISAALLKQAADAHVVLVGVSGLAPTAQIPCVGCGPKYNLIGANAAKVAQADSSNPKLAYITDPSLHGLDAVVDGGKQQVKSAGGSVDQINVSLGQAPAVNNQTVISFVQSHSDVKYVVVGLSDAVAGLPQALKQAGVAAKVKLIYVNQFNIPAGDSAVRDGSVFALVGGESGMTTLRGLDYFVRASVGDEQPKGFVDSPGWVQVVTKANVDKVQRDLQPKGYVEDWYKAWQVG
jgi:ABC-type sugar transport system substrate-binding protein